MIELQTNVGVQVRPDELGRAFSGSMSDDQAEFLSEAAELCLQYDWCTQSCMVAGHIQNKSEVIDFLETLLSHLKQ